MEEKVFVRKLDRLGRITIPIGMREKFGLDFKTEVEIYVENGNIQIAKYKIKCLFCGSDENIENYKEKNVCSKCLNDLILMSKGELVAI